MKNRPSADFSTFLRLGLTDPRPYDLMDHAPAERPPVILATVVVPLRRGGTTFTVTGRPANRPPFESA